jgi:hypothetical protein
VVRVSAERRVLKLMPFVTSVDLAMSQALTNLAVPSEKSSEKSCVTAIPACQKSLFPEPGLISYPPPPTLEAGKAAPESILA